MFQPLTREEDQVYRASAHYTDKAIAAMLRRDVGWVKRTHSRIERKLGSGYTR